MSKKGFTVAEGLVAMVLLGLVTVGIFSAVLASVRSLRAPDIKEDMATGLANAKANILFAIREGQATICQNSINRDLDGVRGDASCELPVSCGPGSTLLFYWRPEFTSNFTPSNSTYPLGNDVPGRLDLEVNCLRRD